MIIEFIDDDGETMGSVETNTVEMYPGTWLNVPPVPEGVSPEDIAEIHIKTPNGVEVSAF